MFIRSIVINGFKAFAKSTRIDFKSGLCALMGPNGCGKSNVIDAIKWALGEQSPSQMRGYRMEDVIFAGSQTSHRVGMAEVTISFNNTNSILPTSDTTVTVTRRLYRTGESEYLLNDEPCRLKDVTSLFSDTGLVNNSSMIIEQGRMDKILSKNPVERRHPFEESSGIGSYKEKRQECKLKITQSQNFLQQAQLTNQELRIREEALLLQAEKAQKYTSYQNQLHSLGLQILVNKSFSLQKESASLQQELLSVSDELQKSQLSFSDLSELFQKQEKQLFEEKFLLEKSIQECDSLQNQIQLSSSTLKNTQQELQLAKQNQLSVQKSIDDLRLLSQPLQTSISESETVQENIKSQLQEFLQQLENTQNLISQKNTHLTQLQNDWDSLKQVALDLSKQIIIHLEKIPKNWKSFQFSSQEKKIIISQLQLMDKSIQNFNEENFSRCQDIWNNIKKSLYLHTEFLETEFSLQSILLEENSPYIKKQLCDQEITQLLSLIQEVSEEIFKLQQKVEFCNQKIHLLQKDLLSNQSTIAHLHQSLLENTLKLKHDQNLLQDIINNIAILTKKECEQNQLLQEYQLSLQQKQKTLQNLQNISVQTPISKENITKLQNSIDSLSAQKQSIYTRLQIIEHEQKILRKASLDNYGDSLELLESNTSISTLVNLSSLEKQFKKIKNTLEQMGNVNLLAQQELVEIQAKLGNVFTHIEDTLACIRQATSLSKELDSLCESRFLHTFDRIQKQFQTVFNRLFGSGIATLSLLDPQNPLESGIDISVEIPGKKIQGLHLLSGGEKTLVTIALIFSIFLVKPAPLCILDEIDAPLDKVNVDRFVHLLKEFKENTQFLIVSHNEETLSAMDYVYGITMRDGSSQIFSMNINHV